MKTKLDPTPWYDDPRRVEPKRLERLRKVADLWNKAGLGVRATADRIGCSPGTVSKDRRLLIDLWKQTVTADVDEIIARELAKLDEQESELWLAWERSKRDRERTLQREKREPLPLDPDGSARAEVVTERETTRTTEGRNPDARYMDLILEIGKRRERMLGLDKGIPIRVEGFDLRALIQAAHENEIEVHKRTERRRKKRARDDGESGDDRS